MGTLPLCSVRFPCLMGRYPEVDTHKVDTHYNGTKLKIFTGFPK